MAHECESCKVYYEISWRNDGVSFPEFCPFCGDESKKEKEEASS